MKRYDYSGKFFHTRQTDIFVSHFPYAGLTAQRLNDKRISEPGELADDGKIHSRGNESFLLFNGAVIHYRKTGIDWAKEKVSRLFGPKKPADQLATAE